MTKRVIGDPMQTYPTHVAMTGEEAAELVAYMQHQYLSQRSHPALYRLLERLSPKPRPHG